MFKLKQVIVVSMLIIASSLVTSNVLASCAATSGRITAIKMLSDGSKIKIYVDTTISNPNSCSASDTFVKSVSGVDGGKFSTFMTAALLSGKPVTIWHCSCGTWDSSATSPEPSDVFMGQ